jgi:drug/metabolite transporter (DMT)-like permease
MQNRRFFQPVDAALLIAVLIWGTNISVTKTALAEISPLAFNTIRFTIAPTLLLIFARLIDGDIAVPRSVWPMMAVTGVLGHFAHQMFFVLGMARTTATNTALLLAMTPIFVGLMGVASGSERLQRSNWLGIVLSFAGIFLVIGTQGPGLQVGQQTLSGDLLVLGCVVLWALYIVLSKDLVQRTSPLKAAAWTMACGAPLIVLAGIPQFRAQHWHAVSMGSWLGLGYSTVFSLAISYAIWNTGVRKVGSARVAVYSYLTPLVTVIFSTLFLGEVMRPLQAVGGLAVLIGVAMGRRDGSG